MKTFIFARNSGGKQDRKIFFEKSNSNTFVSFCPLRANARENIINVENPLLIEAI